MKQSVCVILLLGSSMVAKKDSLKKYHEKRDFKKTAEPRGTLPSSPRLRRTRRRAHGELMFVVQKHDASHLHYDFRLEVDGVLVSWAVPKGFSFDPSVKHLAIQTEDHPYEYGSFEGIIPQGEYGGGTVMLWDTGTYTNIKEKDGKLVPMDECLKRGTVEIELHGKRLKGAFALIKMRGRGEKQWLMIKMDDTYADRERTKLPKSWDRSVTTKRTMKQIAAEKERYE